MALGWHSRLSADSLSKWLAGVSKDLHSLCVPRLLMVFSSPLNAYPLQMQACGLSSLEERRENCKGSFQSLQKGRRFSFQDTRAGGDLQKSPPKPRWPLPSLCRGGVGGRGK